MNFYHAVDVFDKTGLVQAVTSTRRGGLSRAPYHWLNLGNHVGDDPETVTANRQMFFDRIGLERQNCVYCRQVHSNRVLLIDHSTSQQATVAEGDAMITANPFLALGVLTADCVPIFIFDAGTPAIGIAHAGWRGTLGEIALKTIDAMENHFGTSPSNCLVHLGPSIQKCCYTVSASLADEFEAAFGSHVRSSKYALDLQGANIHQFVQAGVSSHAISVTAFCTACRTDLFYSHRAEGGRTGRMLSLLWLR